MESWRELLVHVCLIAMTILLSYALVDIVPASEDAMQAYDYLILACIAAYSSMIVGLTHYISCKGADNLRIVYSSSMLGIILSGLFALLAWLRIRSAPDAVNNKVSKHLTMAAFIIAAVAVGLPAVLGLCMFINKRCRQPCDEDAVKTSVYRQLADMVGSGDYFPTEEEFMSQM